MFLYVSIDVHIYCTCIYIYVYACIQNCPRTYMHACMRACIHAYIHTYMPTYLHTYIPTYLHTYIPTYLHTYMHTYIHVYKHAKYEYTHIICVHMCMCSHIHTCCFVCFARGLISPCELTTPGLLEPIAYLPAYLPAHPSDTDPVC